MFSLLIIGNEILSGAIADTNLAYMLRRFRELSIPVDEVRIIPDHLETIVNALKELKEQSAYVISSGGIGPTHDDLTLEAYAVLFGVDLIENTDMKQRVQRFFGESLKPGHRYLYRVPEHTELLYGDDQNWPVYKLGNCFILPGLPEIFVKKFDDILKNLPAQPEIFKKEMGVHVSEGYFAEELEALQKRYPDVEIGSYPLYRGSWDRTAHPRELAVKITFKCLNQEKLERCYQDLAEPFTKRGWLHPC
jgi:molybdenum cofactor synthesis domain-containing protein